MELDRLRSYLDDFKQAEPWLKGLKLVDLKRGHGNLMRMATGGITLDLLASICDQLQIRLPLCADPDMAYEQPRPLRERGEESPVAGRAF